MTRLELTLPRIELGERPQTRDATMGACCKKHEKKLSKEYIFYFQGNNQSIAAKDMRDRGWREIERTSYFENKLLRLRVERPSDSTRVDVYRDISDFMDAWLTEFYAI